MAMMVRAARRLAIAAAAAACLGAAVADAAPAHRAAAARRAAHAATAQVRRLDVLIVVYTRSFSRTLTAPQLERLQEEIVEFADFYRRHGGDRVDFRFSLLQLDRELRLDEVGAVSPGKYYLSREDITDELRALGLDRRDFDEVVTFYAWDNANPAGARLAYGGAAVGPDGGFLGDAGYNSIGVFAWDPARIAQVAIHEVLHNLDDMFSRSGMAEEFLNSDEMSRNMPTLLRERPGAFLPHFSDAEMLAYAERERAGKESYPWWMQRIYYAWMLERTPASQWVRLKYGAMADPPPAATRSLYDEVWLSAATHRLYLPFVPDHRATSPAASTGAPLRIELGGATATVRSLRYALEDFDGTPIEEGSYSAGWLELPGSRPGDLRLRVGGRDAARIHRLPLAEVVAPERIVAYRDDPGPAPLLEATVRAAAWPEPGAPIAAATLEARSGDRTIAMTPAAPGSFSAPLPESPGVYDLRGSSPGHIVWAGRTVVESRLAWSVHAPADVEAAPGSRVELAVGVVEDRTLPDAAVVAHADGRDFPARRLPAGGYAVELDGLAPGLHQVEIAATRPGSARVVVDTMRVFVRPSGWIRAPLRLSGTAGTPVRIEASLRSRMGEPLTGLALPLVVVAGDGAIRLVEGTDGTYSAEVALPAGTHRLVLTSLVGDFQRRVVVVDVAPATGTPPAAAPPVTVPGPQTTPPAGGSSATAFVAAPKITVPPTLDGDLSEWTGTPARIAGDHVIAGVRNGGAGDLDARVWFAWSDSALYLAGSVVDDAVTVGEAWDRDRVNLVFDWREDTTPLTYGNGSPEPAAWQPDDFWLFFQPFHGEGKPGVVNRIDRQGMTAAKGARLASRRTPKGYDFEAMIPASALPEYAPFVGHAAGVQIFVSDGDPGEPLTEAMWSASWGYDPSAGISWELWNTGRLILADVPIR